jgi:dTDP-4-amino-4,6-dideoxygalactose transaminase
MINVSKPFLPPLEEYIEYLKGIWDRNWLTNNGPLVNELELKLKEYLKVNHLLYLTNGTTGIQIAIKALNLDGEIITTPFSYIATSSSIAWEGCTPIFVDIDPKSLNINPLLIEQAITKKTRAILATHVYGNPCDIDSIQKIANKNNLKVIYDAAHCFGTRYKKKSVYEFGDVSIASFHATKLYNTAEGGAVITKDAALLKKMAFLRNFGHDGYEKFAEVGINAKNSEFHAALGLLNLKYIDKILMKLKRLSLYYDERLKNLEVKKIVLNPKAEYNYSYYPIIFKNEKILKDSIDALNENLIYPRRYFYPSLNKLNIFNIQKAPISEDVSRRVLCLPLYYTLTFEEIDLISRLLLRAQNNA